MKFKIFRILFALTASVYFLSCGKDVSVSPPEAPAPTGAFGITSNPPGAEIFVNNKTTGRVTPDSLSWLSAGKYAIKLRLWLYRDTVISINVSEDHKTKVSVDFNANPAMHGSIVCQSRPDHADIYLNGQPTQKQTPYTLEGLLPGAYNITFKTYGCRNDSMRVIVKSSAVEHASGMLQDTTIWITYNKKNSGLPSDNLTCIAVDGKDAAWIGTIDRGLVTFDGKNWKVYNTSNSALPSNNITSLAIQYSIVGSTAYQTIYIGTPEGLAILPVTKENNQTLESKVYVFNKSNSPLPDNYVTSVSVDKWNYAWVGTEKGLMLVPGEWSKMKAYDLTSTLGENSVTCVAATASDYGMQHQVYIGLLSKGLASFDYSNSKWMHYSSPDNNLPNNELRSIGAGRWTDVYFGCALTESSASGLGHMSNGGFDRTQFGTYKNSYTSIFARPDGSIWACTTEGLFYRQSQSSPVREFNVTNSKLPSNSLTGVALDSGGKVWIATSYNGLVVYKQYLDK